ncbi:MAG: protein kinase [Gemmatimonadales bacterium]
MSDVLGRLTAALADRYRIERELGAGGMATVYLAHDIKHDRDVAIKVLKPELAAVLGAERFVVEIKTTAALQHPNILPLFDSGVADSFFWYAMPFIDGETLRAKLDRETQLGVDEAVKLTIDVADALNYAHSKGVIHRDIKPENILLANGRPMVADFGIALAVSAAAGGRMTETGLSLGTPHYMSPEQATADKTITGRSDIYSLASVCFEMLAGQPPHLGGSAQQIIMKIIAEPVDPVTRYRKSVPPNVAAALDKALEKLAADRFETAKAFADALANPAFTLAPDASTAASASRRRRARWPIFAVAAATLLVAAASVTYGRRGLIEPLVSRQRIDIWQGPLGSNDVAWGLAISPDGSTLVFSDTVNGTRQLWSKERDRLDATILAGTRGAQAPVFSPDGQWVAFVVDGKLKKVPRLGGSTVTLADGVGYPAIAWLDDGTIAFANNQPWGLTVVGQDGGTVRRVIGTDSLRGYVATVTALPGGHGVLLGLCAFGCPSSRLVALDLDAAAAPKTLAENVIKGWPAPEGSVVFVRRDGGVFAAKFDRGRLSFQGSPVPVLDGVQTAPVAANMTVGADGTLIYVSAAVKGTAVEGVWVTRRGVVSAVDSTWSFVPERLFSMALSPDGERLAVGVGRDIWIKELFGGRQFTRLTFGKDTMMRPAWTHDGRSVLYIAVPADAPSYVVSRHADGTGDEVTVLKANRPVMEVETARNAAPLIVRTGRLPTMDIELSTGGSDSLIPLVSDARYGEFGPAISPDGRWLAYSSSETGTSQVYVRPFPTVGEARWPVSTDGGSEPQWSHSGRELFFRDSVGGLIAAQLKPGPAFAIATQQRLFSTTQFQRDASHRSYAVAPGDNQFLFFRSAGAGNASAGKAASLVLVDHWFEELKAKTKAKAVGQ